jgi:hypothetical protein
LRFTGVREANRQQCKRSHCLHHAAVITFFGLAPPEWLPRKDS